MFPPRDAPGGASPQPTVMDFQLRPLARTGGPTPRYNLKISRPAAAVLRAVAIEERVTCKAIADALFSDRQLLVLTARRLRGRLDVPGAVECAHGLNPRHSDC